MREGLARRALVDPDSTSEFCSVEPESWHDSPMVRLDFLRRRAGLTRSWTADAAAPRHEVAPATRQAFFRMLQDLAPRPPTRVVREDLAKVWGHKLDTGPDARVH